MSIKSLCISAFAVSFLFLASCANNTLQHRLSQNSDLLSSLSSQDQIFVNKGEIKEGMSKKAVYLAWGAPSRTSKGANKGTSYEGWYYVNNIPFYTRNFYSSYGYQGRGYHGAAVHYGPNDYSCHLEAKVEFNNGRVIRWEKAQ